jgi:hypothetical protein
VEAAVVRTRKAKLTGVVAKKAKVASLDLKADFLELRAKYDNGGGKPG